VACKNRLAVALYPANSPYSHFNRPVPIFGIANRLVTAVVPQNVVSSTATSNDVLNRFIVNLEITSGGKVYWNGRST
jgi:hypothetical protein